MIPKIQHSRKGKTKEIAKSQWLPGVGEREGVQRGRVQGIFKA